MGDNRKILIEIVTKTSGAEKKIKGVGDAADGAGEKAEGARKSFFGLGKTLGAIARGFIIVKSFQLLAQTISSTIKVLAEFELTMNKVKAITGANEQEFKKLENSAKELALGTMFTANQVGELQLAYSKLGFTTKDILAAAEATLNLATITGDSLSNAADVAGAAVRGFGLDASETTRVVDVMASSFSSSALNLDSFRQSMKTVAPIARAANIDIETTSALLAKLADAGLRGTRAATGLKNIMSDLTDPTSDLAKSLGFTVNNSEGLSKAFREMSKRGIDLSKATQLVDERSKAAFITLVNGTGDVERLTTKFKNARGKAQEMADTIGDSLSVKWDMFRSAVEGFTLREGQGLISILGTALTSLTEFINETDRGYRVMQLFKEAQDDVARGLDTTMTPTEELTEALKKSGKEYDDLETKLKSQKKELAELKEINDKTVQSVREGITTAKDNVDRKELEIQKTEEQLSAINNLNKEQREELILRQKRMQSSVDLVDEMSKEVARLEGLRHKVPTVSQEYDDLTERIKKLREELNKLGAIAPTTKVSGLTDAETKKAKKDHDKRIKAEIKLEKLRAEQVIGSAETVRRAKVAALEFERKKIKELNEYKDASGEEQVAMEEDVNNRIFQINKKHGEKLAKENEKLNAEAQKERERVASEIENFEAEMLQMRIDAGVALMQAGFDMYQVLANNRMETMARENEAEMTSFTDLQDEKLSRFDIDQKEEIALFEGTQEQKAQFEKQKGLERLEFEKEQEQAREALRKKQLKEENAAAKEAFKVEKANTIAKIAIQTALGIAQINGNPTVNADPSLFTLRALMTALITGTGAAQAAVVGAQKFQPKTFQDGGMIEGASHSEGGVPFTVAGRAGFEAEGGEYIFSRNTVDRLGTGLLDAINFGGAAPRMFADGGAVSRASVASSAMNQSEMAQMIGEVVASSVAQIPVVNVATETDSLSRMVQNAEAMATI